MRKSLGWNCWAALMPLLLAACASKPPEPLPVEAPPVVAPPVAAPVVAPPPPACPFPDSVQDAAPEWVCQPSVPGAVMVALGRTQGTSAAGADVQALAAQAAQADLAKHMQAHLSSLFRQYSETNHLANADLTNRLSASLLAQTVAQPLTGTQVVSGATSPKGIGYALVSLPPQQVQANALRILKASMTADKALWQRIKTKKKPADLAAAIAAAASN
jgi:hypothetical protein